MRGSSIRHALVSLIFITLTAQACAQDSHPQLDRVDARVDELMAEGHFPGVAIAVLRDGRTVHVGSYGMADIGGSVPVTTKTVFELASLTKQMTALAVLTLVEEGRLALDTRITTLVDGAPAGWEGITVNQLLSHMGGLAHRFEETVNGVLLLEYTRADMLASAMKTPMVADPGTDWNYSDQGYFLLGLAIESVTGKPYDQYMQATFFRPLGMSQTHLLDQRRIVPHLAQGYSWNDGEMQRNRRVWQFALTPHFGVMSSLADMMRWEAELADPRVIDPAALAATLDIQRTFDTGQTCDTWGYARGWWVRVVNGKHVADHAGYSGTGYARAIEDGLSAIVLTNREDAAGALSPMAFVWAALHEVDPQIPAEGYACWE